MNTEDRQSPKFEITMQGYRVPESDEVEAIAERGVRPRCRIVVISYRSRLCDPDGICSKWLIDSLTGAGIIDDDSIDHVESVEFAQIKVKKSEEKTVIQVYEI